MIALDNYIELRSELAETRRIAAELKSFGVLVFHDLFSAPNGERWDKSELELAKNSSKSRSDVCWESWSDWPGDVMVSRFWGPDRSSEQFVRTCRLLLHRMSRVFCELRRLNAAEETPRGVMLNELEVQDLPNLGSGPYISLLLIHEWSYRFPTKALRGSCKWWSAFPATIDADEEDQPTHNLLFADLISAIVAFIDMCLEEVEPVRTGIWDHIPQLSLPNLPVDKTLEWLSEELPFLVRDLQLYGKLIESQDVTATKTSPQRMAIVINSLKELSSLIELSSQDQNARFEKTEITFARLKVSLQECESIRAHYEPLMVDDIWRRINDWIQSYPSRNVRDSQSFSSEMKNWLTVGTTLLEEAMKSCIGADIWPSIDGENKTVTWLGDTKVLSSPNDLELLGLLVQRKNLKTPYRNIEARLYCDEPQLPETIRQAKRSLVERLKIIGFGGLAASIVSPFPKNYWIDEKRLLSHAMSTVTNAVQN